MNFDWFWTLLRGPSGSLMEVLRDREKGEIQLAQLFRESRDIVAYILTWLPNKSGKKNVNLKFNAY